MRSAHLPDDLDPRVRRAVTRAVLFPVGVVVWEDGSARVFYPEG